MGIKKKNFVLRVLSIFLMSAFSAGLGKKIEIFLLSEEIIPLLRERLTN